MKIDFYDFKRGYSIYKDEIAAAINKVLASGNYILGEETGSFEREFASYCASSYGIGVGSGTEALHIALLAAGIGYGSEVITVANAGVPTVVAIMLTGAMPVFVDIDEKSYTIDTAKVEEKITSRTKAIIPIHLYGQCADMSPLLDIAKRRKLFIVEDACQSHGATYEGRRAGSIGHIGCFSFYPTKNLGAYGDGGIIVTSDENLAKKARMLREYGQTRRYYHEIFGINSRLDEIQSAILRLKLLYLDSWNKRRVELAEIYNENISNDLIMKPYLKENCNHVYHLYVIRCDKRKSLIRYLSQSYGIQALVHYPYPVYTQKAYKNLFHDSLPVTEKCAGSVLSLPLYPELTNDEAFSVSVAINNFKG